MKPAKRNLFFSFLLVTISTPLSFTLLECYVRLNLPEFSDTHVIALRDYDNKYHHHFFGKIPPLLDDRLRILFLGDSFTQGYGMKQDSFPAQVEVIWNAKNTAKIQSFNLGSSSYSPSIYGALLRDHFDSIRPDVVVIAVDDSDPQDDFLYRHSLKRDETGMPISVHPHVPGVPGSLQFLARRSKAFRLLAGHLARRMERWFTQSESNRYFGAYENRLAHLIPEETDRWAPRFAYTTDILKVMVEYCRNRNVPVLLVNYPYAPSVTKKYELRARTKFRLGNTILYQTAFHEAVKMIAIETGAAYYDFTPYLRSLSDHRGIFIENDGHYTVMANRLFAAELVDPISELLKRSLAAYGRQVAGLPSIPPWGLRDWVRGPGVSWMLTSEPMARPHRVATPASFSFRAERSPTPCGLSPGSAGVAPARTPPRPSTGERSHDSKRRA